jgi:hypothetical protein
MSRMGQSGGDDRDGEASDVRFAPKADAAQ